MDTGILRSSKVGPYPVNIGKMGEIRILVRIEDRDKFLYVKIRRLSINLFERRNSIVGIEFDRYIKEHPEF